MTILEFVLVFSAGFEWGFAIATRGERVRMREDVGPT